MQYKADKLIRIEKNINRGTNIIRIVSQTVRRTIKEILGLKGLKLHNLLVRLISSTKSMMGLEAYLNRSFIWRVHYSPSKLYNSISAGSLPIYRNTCHIPMLFKLMVKTITDTTIYKTREDRLAHLIKTILKMLWYLTIIHQTGEDHRWIFTELQNRTNHRAKFRYQKVKLMRFNR